jgi:ATP-dependent DNA helicase DinG
MTDVCVYMLDGRFSTRVDKDKEELLPSLNRLQEQIKRYSASLSALEKEVRALPLDKHEAKVEGPLVDIGRLTERLEKWADMLGEFAKEPTKQQVHYLKREGTMPELIHAELEVGEAMKELLFSKLDTAVLCSATLSLGGDFAHIKRQLGIEGCEKIFPSPFDYQSHALLCVPTDLPLPGDRGFPQAASALIAQAIEASGGGAFVLFTSYEMLSACRDALQGYLGSSYPIFEQGNLSRTELLNSFKESGNGVLLGTDSFWEGVDVPGHALRLVIITRLPFPVPSDPIVEARGEWLTTQGKSAFGEDSLPRAAVKLKQGFGRLIRSASDRGCVVCLDNRLVTRSYGKKLLASLPECRMATGSKSHIINELDLFYRVGA